MLFIVEIDPGHGGSDRDNRGPTGYIEADGVLDISLFMEEAFNEYKDVQVILTRREDISRTLVQRGMIGSIGNVFISVHTNADWSGLARGTEVFYSVDIPEDRALAAKISANIAKEYNVPDRGAKIKESYVQPNEDFYTVIDTAQDYGATHVFLLEALFHSNIEDEKILKDKQERKKIGYITANTIAEHMKLELKDPEIRTVIGPKG